MSGEDKFWLCFLTLVAIFIMGLVSMFKITENLEYKYFAENGYEQKVVPSSKWGTSDHIIWVKIDYSIPLGNTNND